MISALYLSPHIKKEAERYFSTIETGK